MAIPLKLEELILEGKAKFETFQVGMTELSVIPVRDKEHIIITGFHFMPAVVARYMDSSNTAAKATIQRIEFFDGKNYSHHIAKMTGSQGVTETRDLNELHEDNLYLVFKDNVGIMITVPIFGPIDLQAGRDNLTGNNGNTAKKIVNQGTNPYLTAPQAMQILTESASPGTSNIPSNIKVNGPEFSQNLQNGPYTGQETNQFQFTSEPGNVIYGGLSNYSSLDPEDFRKNFFLNVKYVRVFASGDNLR